MPAPVPAPTILIVEDEVVIRVLMRRALEAVGYRVFTAESGATGLAELAYPDRAFDLLIADLGLADMNGRQVVQQAVAARPGLRVILITGDAPAGTETYPLLLKPFRLDDLVDLIAARLRLAP